MASSAPLPTPEQIQAQLERLVASPHIRHSKRSQALLTYVVEAHLAGSLDRIKERTIGVEVFHRDPAYDTNDDPVVRTTAVEIRKRLAQYYSDPGHENELRVLLPPGSYVPEFRDASVAPAAESSPKFSWIWLTAIIPAAAMVWFLAGPARATDLDRFWRPILEDGPDTVICIEQPLRIYRFDGPRFDELNQKLVGTATQPALSRDQLARETISMAELESAGNRYFANGDMLAAMRTGEFLARHGKSFQVLGDRGTSYQDLRGRPAVLIGQFNHQWSAILAAGLRYYLDKDPEKRLYLIRDRVAQGRVVFSVTADENRQEEYVVVSRLFQAPTEKMLINIASMTFRGSSAGGDFLTNGSYLHEALKDAPRGWENKNVQVVLKTVLVSGTAGPPVVVATYFW